MGNYFMIVTDNNGCSSDTSNVIYFIGNGISSLDGDGNIAVYPNPARDVITISVNTDKAIESVSIINVLGKTVKTIAAKNIIGKTDYSIDVKDLYQGIYFLCLQMDGKRIAKKVIVE